MSYYDVKPYLQVDYQRQLGDRDSKVSAAINSTATSFTTSTNKGRQDSVKAVVGANFPLNKTLKGYISTSYSNQNRDDMFSYTLGLSASF
jgi:outer membrane lipase/esterase